MLPFLPAPPATTPIAASSLRRRAELPRASSPRSSSFCQCSGVAALNPPPLPNPPSRLAILVTPLPPAPPNPFAPEGEVES